MHKTILYSLIFLISSLSSISLGQQLIFSQGNNINNNESESGIPSSINGIRCDEIEHLVFHTHTQLTINKKNGTVTIPANIGIIPGTCIFWLHTHDDSGWIHIESPINSTFTLGSFIDIWGKFDNSSIAKDLSQIQDNSTAPKSLQAFEDKEPINLSESSIRDIKLRDNSTIVLNFTN
jgi:hypothetical protein